MISSSNATRSTLFQFNPRLSAMQFANVSAKAQQQQPIGVEIIEIRERENLFTRQLDGCWMTGVNLHHSYTNRKHHPETVVRTFINFDRRRSDVHSVPMCKLPNGISVNKFASKLGVGAYVQRSSNNSALKKRIHRTWTDSNLDRLHTLQNMDMYKSISRTEEIKLRSQNLINPIIISFGFPLSNT